MLPELAINPLADRIASVVLKNDPLNQSLTFEEFVEVLEPFSPKSSRIDKLKCKKLIYAVAFKVYDVDCDGIISFSDLFLVLKAMAGKSIGEDTIKKIAQETIFEADLNQDKVLSFEEFKLALFNFDVEKVMTISV